MTKSSATSIGKRRGPAFRVIALLIVLSLPAYFHLAHGIVTWSSSPSLVAQNPGADVLPSSLQASDGTIWLAWQSNALNPTSSRSDIFYKTLAGGTWSTAQNITNPNKPVNNAGPALVQNIDRTIFLFWAANTTGTFKIFSQTYSHGAWSKGAQATVGPLMDCSPSTALGKDGTLWLFWSRGITCYSGTADLFYKTLRAGVWSAEIQLTFDTAAEIESKATVTSDGRIWLVFAEYISSKQNSQIFYTVYNGVSWSAEIQLVSSTLFDDHPDVIQDRNGTLWLFWTREISLGGGLFDDKIFNKSSLDNGVTWSTENQMTFDPACCQVDDWGPSAIQGFDHTIWLFYSSSYPMGGNFDIYYLQSIAMFPVHDVSVSLITTSPSCPFPSMAASSPSCLYPGGMKIVGESPVVKVNMTIANPGDFSETVTVLLTAVNSTSYLAGSATGTVNPGRTTVLTIVWNTTSSLKPGRYGLQASILAVPGETIGNRGDDSLLTSNLVHLIPLGDVDQDGSVKFVDVSVVAYGFQSRPGSPNWNPYADSDSDGFVSFIDVSIAAANFGITT